MNGPHRRRNSLTGEWVLVSPQRTARPWQGEVAENDAQAAPQYDPSCYLCPGNVRANARHNPRYDGVYVFDNDFPALLKSSEIVEESPDGLLMARSESGRCRVVCFSPRHDLSLFAASPQERRAVIDAWAQEYRDLGSDPQITWVQIFENRGAMMGASNPHPHGQIWAESSVPNEPRKEQAEQRRYLEEYGTCLLCTYVQAELMAKERIVCKNDRWLVVVPYWAVWPFETLLLPIRHATDLAALDDAHRDGLADAIAGLGRAYDGLFNVPFPYSMGFHQRPTDGETHDEWHLHAHYYPPLLRSATIRKFAVGYEMLSQSQRDITPEDAAQRLRAAV